MLRYCFQVTNESPVQEFRTLREAALVADKNDKMPKIYDRLKKKFVSGYCVLGVLLSTSKNTDESWQKLGF
jgi:hypothetical protein